MGRTSAPPQNFGSAQSAPIMQPQQRPYTPNPFAANRPPPGPLPPGLRSGEGMTPERWRDEQNTPQRGNFFGKNPKWIGLQMAQMLRNASARRANPSPASPTSAAAPQQGPNRQAMMASMLRNGGGMR